ncbi:MAG: P-loop NTPase fold protein [Bacteroidales bacterium]|nr:P-loop NTPase fold protein [Bacteroidales bacterium]
MKWIKNNFKLIVFLVVLLVSFFVFEKFWVDLVNKFWVNPIASKIGCNILWVLLVFSFVVIFYYILEYCYSKTFNRKRLVIVLTFSAINILCFFSDNWKYTSEWTSFIIIIVLPLIGEFIGAVILGVKNKIKNKENETPELEREKTTKIEDTYNRKEFWESTYNTLNTCFFEEGSFSVAISGSWGSGKTVFMEKLKEQYKENKYVSIIEFEAWRCDTPNLIIRNFFTQLKNKLKIYIPNISLDFDKYIDLLLNDDSVKPLKIISKAIYNICKQEKDPFNKIKEELKKSKHKVVVFIDDVDRLDADEIKEVLRLIRNTADFPYIQFIFTCDKDYICETLKKKDIEKPELYLEKFINVEISLPKYEERIICEELYKRISKTIKEVWGNNVADNEIKDMIYYKLMEKNETEINRYLIPKILRTNRDIIHFYNTFKLIAEIYKTQKNQTEIEFQDLFFIELLKFKYPNIHSYLWLNPIKFLNLNNNNLSIAWIRGKESKTRIDDIINDITNNTLNTNLSLSILKYLFENNSKKHSISNTENFDSYFMYRLNNKYLTMLQALSIIRDNKDNNFNIYNIEIIFNNKNKKQFEDRVSEILYNLTLEGDLNYIDIYNF